MIKRMSPKSHQKGSVKRRPYLSLLLLTLAGLLVHGYHPMAEDAEIYIPSVKKVLNPALYPFGSEFFLHHASLTQFDRLIAMSVRISHLSFDAAVFLWYLASIFLTLLACWDWAEECFIEKESRFAGVALVAALLTLPVAGTSLYIADQYLTPRSLVLFALLFATLNAWRGRYVRFAVWSIFAGLMHPLMAVFGVSFGLLLAGMKYAEAGKTAAVPVWALLFMPDLGVLPASDAYREAVQTRSYFFLLQWHWYEWIGIFAPLALLWWFSQSRRRKETRSLRRVSWSLVTYGLAFFVLALILTTQPRLETLARLQPMRSLHLLYTFLIVLGGGLLGKYVLKRHALRWVILFLPLCAGMWFAQRQLFPDSPHIEWPGVAPMNHWLRAFEWIRSNTPSDALFAIDPNYMLSDDQHGFRAIAERSRLADAVKDSGAVTMFPDAPFPEHWLEQVTDQRRWAGFKAADFHRLQHKYGVSWVVLRRPGIRELACPYQNDTLLVCRLD